jgi:hypothetical protein
MPGRIAAANYVFNAAPSGGTTIALVQRGILLAKLIYPTGIRFEIGKFHWIGSLNSETAVTLAWHTAPHKRRGRSRRARSRRPRRKLGSSLPCLRTMTEDSTGDEHG